MKKCLPLLIVIGVAIWSVWPAVVKPAGVADYGRDGWLIAWIENSWQEKFTDYIRSGRIELTDLFSGDIFYPYKSVLAYTSMLMLSGFVGWGGPGAVMVVGQAATMAITYLWFKKLGAGRWSAVVGTAAFGLARARWEYQVHMQIWSMQYWLAGAWLVCSGIDDKKLWKLVTGGVILGLQMWEEPLGIYFAALLIAAKSITNYQFSIFNQFSISKFSKLIILISVFGVISFLPAREYWRVSRDFNFVRSIRDAAYHGLSINGFGRFYSPGIFILFIFALYTTLFGSPSYLRRGIGGGNSQKKWLMAVLIVSVILSLGPVVKWDDKTVKIGGVVPIPLPYAAAYYLVPGMQAFRVPSRWMQLAGWAMGGLIALVCNTPPGPPLNSKNQKDSSLLTSFAVRGGRKGGVKKIIAVFGCFVLAILGGERLTKYKILPTPAEFPKVYQWLKDQPGQVIAELPAGNENDEIERMWYQTRHEKKLLGGYSGFMPPDRAKLLDQLNKDPYSKGTIDELRETDVDYIISHDSRFMNYDLRIIYDDGESRVYEL